MKLLAQCKEKEKCPEDIPWYIFPTKSKKREIKSRFPEIESWRQILLTTSAYGLSFFFSFFVGLFFFFLKDVGSIFTLKTRIKIVLKLCRDTKFNVSCLKFSCAF